MIILLNNHRGGFLSTSIPVSFETQLMLKELRLQLEKKLKRGVTWDEFFNKVKIKINGSNKKKRGEND